MLVALAHRPRAQVSLVVQTSPSSQRPDIALFWQPLAVQASIVQPLPSLQPLLTGLNVQPLV